MSEQIRGFMLNAPALKLDKVLYTIGDPDGFDAAMQEFDAEVYA